MCAAAAIGAAANHDVCLLGVAEKGGLAVEAHSGRLTYHPQMGLRHCAMVVAALVACGNTHDDAKKHPIGGHGSGAAGSAGSASAGTGSDSWNVVALRKGYAILSSGVLAAGEHRVVVVAADGRIAARITVDDASTLKTSNVSNGVLIWIDSTVHAWDLAKGVELWSSKLDSRAMVVGHDHVAIVHDKGTDIVAITDGKTSYHRDGAAGVDVAWKDGTFVAIDAAGGIEAIDEAGVKPRWTAKLANPSSAPGVAIAKGRVFAFGTADVIQDNGGHTLLPGRFVEIDLATGKGISKGTIEEHVPGTLAPGSEQTLVSTDDGSFEQAKPEQAPLEVFRLDPVRRVQWKSTAWPLNDEYEREPALLKEAGTLSALMLRAKWGTPDHVLIVFDTKTGKLRFTQKLGTNGYLLTFVPGCVAVLDGAGGKLSCLDDATGKPVWTRLAGGRDPLAWGFSGSDGDGIFLVDGNPAALSRVDLTNKVLWQIPLPDGADCEGKDVSATVIAIPLKGQALIIDPTSGKLSKATL
jgi:outer membrane protein assembly factor BamB